MAEAETQRGQRAQVEPDERQVAQSHGQRRTAITTSLGARLVRYPLAVYITWTTYGTWLHGDARSSYLDNKPLPPDAARENEMRSQLTDETVYLTDEQRGIVSAAIAKECAEQG